MKDEGSIYDPFSFRPPQELAARYAEFCDQLGYRKTQGVSACIEAVLEMIEAPEVQVPRLVTMVRTLRETRSTLKDAPREFTPAAVNGGSGGKRRSPSNKVVPFRRVHAPPAHLLVPLFGKIAAGHPTNENQGPQQPLEYVPVPEAKARGAKYALQVAGESMNRSKEGIQDGDIVLMADPENRRPVSGDIVAALIDGETCLKRFHSRKPGESYLESESDNPAFGQIHPARELVIQGVFIDKL
jgi:SOS-response transcriptional repressor LexA